MAGRIAERGPLDLRTGFRTAWPAEDGGILPNRPRHGREKIHDAIMIGRHSEGLAGQDGSRLTTVRPYE